jgi:tol-pal system protein YbgF
VLRRLVMTACSLHALRASLLTAALLTAAGQASAQVSATDLMVRIDRLEAQIRQLTGSMEQLQFRNQQLEGQLRRLQEDAEFRFQELGSKAARPSAPTRSTATPSPAQPPAAQVPAAPQAQSQVQSQAQSQVQVAPAAPAGRRGDAFDPSQNPTAPGVPRALGSTAVQPGTPADQAPVAEAPPIGAPGGRAAGAPLDLSTVAPGAGSDPQQPARNPQVATLPPSQSPRDEFDLGYGYILRKDYALAEDTFRGFLKKYPSDRLVPDAQYWLGEAMFQRQRYRDAGEAFLAVTTKHETAPKAPDALLRLGQSLAALGEKEAACATFGQVMQKYPRASVGVKQGVDREQKRVRC